MEKEREFKISYQCKCVLSNSSGAFPARCSTHDEPIALEDLLPKTNAHSRDATRTDCNNGHTHRSKGEARYCDELHLRARVPEEKILKIEVEFPWPLIVKGIKVTTHKLDFLITYKYGKKKAIEYKRGYRLALGKLKAALFRAIHPDIPYEIVDQ